MRKKEGKKKGSVQFSVGLTVFYTLMKRQYELSEFRRLMIMGAKTVSHSISELKETVNIPLSTLSRVQGITKLRNCDSPGYGIRKSTRVSQRAY